MVKMKWIITFGESIILQLTVLVAGGILFMTGVTGCNMQPSGSSLEHQVVFSQGEDGYHTYRTPSLLSEGYGTLLAFAEARRDDRADPGGGYIDLVYKLSRDGGRNWSEPGDITRQDRDFERWGIAVFGPGHGIETMTGRLVVPVNANAPVR